MEDAFYPFNTTKYNSRDLHKLDFNWTCIVLYLISFSVIREPGVRFYAIQRSTPVMLQQAYLWAVTISFFPCLRDQSNLRMPSSALGSIPATSAAVFLGSSTSFMKGKVNTSLILVLVSNPITSSSKSDLRVVVGKEHDQTVDTETPATCDYVSC